MRSESPSVIKKGAGKNDGDCWDPHGPVLQEFSTFFPKIVSSSPFCQPFLRLSADVFFADDSMIDEVIGCSNQERAKQQQENDKAHNEGIVGSEECLYTCRQQDPQHKLNDDAYAEGKPKQDLSDQCERTHHEVLFSSAISKRHLDSIHCSKLR